MQEAELLYERILELEPGSQEALGNLIAMSMEAFDLARLQRYALRLAGRSPQSNVALQALTLVAFERGDYETAASHFDELMKNAPEQGFSVSDEREDEIRYRLSGHEVEHLSSFRRGAPQGSSKRLNRGSSED